MATNKNEQYPWKIFLFAPCLFFIVFFLQSGCGGGSDSKNDKPNETTQPPTLSASISKNSAALYCGRASVRLTCNTTGTVSSLEGRCNATESWKTISSGDTQVCKFTDEGTYTPSCRINKSIISTVETPVTISKANEKSLDFYFLLSDQEPELNSLEEKYCPPVLESLTLEPSFPKAGQSAFLLAKIYNDSRYTTDKTEQVQIYYSVDSGNTWNTIQMSQQLNLNYWEGQIPGQAPGTNVIYGIKAKDSSGNLYIEASCEISGNPLLSTNYIAQDCVNSNDISQCDAQKPRNCMFPLANDDAPLDDTSDSIPDNSDYWDYRIGYDNDYIYFDLAVEGEISGGSASPFSILFYFINVYNPDSTVYDSSSSSSIAHSALLNYGPLSKLTGGMFNTCSFMHENDTEWIQDSKIIECIEQDNHLIFKVKENYFGDMPDGLLQLLTLSTDLTELWPAQSELYDYSRYTNVRFVQRSYTVR